MEITEKTWVEYITRLARLNAAAGQKMAEYVAKYGAADTNALIEYACALAQKYGEGSAELACQMYDAVAEASGAAVPPAQPAAPATYGETAKMVNATKESPPLLQSGVSRLVKQAAADTTLQNAARDGAEWAWVPHGDTCAFCAMLASNGWQRAGKKTLRGEHARHIHANCDCEYAVRFNGDTNVAGYDPDSYLEEYYAAGGDLNAMRRARYARDKGRINAQKRAAYAARKLREQAGRGILNENGSGYLPITQQSLEAVQSFACRTLDEAGQRVLAEAHRELLRIAYGQPAGTEVARCYGLDMRPLGEIVPGDKPGRVRIPDQTVPYIAAHTHPSGMTFSPGDIRGFVNRENMRILTAVGNDGSIYALERTEGYNALAVRDLTQRLEERIARAGANDQIMEALNGFLKEVRQYGVQYYTTTD